MSSSCVQMLIRLDGRGAILFSSEIAFRGSEMRINVGRMLKFVVRQIDFCERFSISKCYNLQVSRRPFLMSF